MTVRHEAHALLELTFKFVKADSKQAKRLIFHQAAGGEKCFRADREVLEGLL